MSLPNVIHKTVFFLSLCANCAKRAQQLGQVAPVQEAVLCSSNIDCGCHEIKSGEAVVITKLLPVPLPLCMGLLSHGANEEHLEKMKPAQPAKNIANQGRATASPPELWNGPSGVFYSPFGFCCIT